MHTLNGLYCARQKKKNDIKKTYSVSEKERSLKKKKTIRQQVGISVKDPSKPILANGNTRSKSTQNFVAPNQSFQLIKSELRKKYSRHLPAECQHPFF